MLCRYILYKYSVLCRQFLTWTGKTAPLSDESELFHLCLKHVGPWPCRAAFPGEPDYLGDIRIPEGGQAGHVVRAQPFQQVVEVAPVVRVSQMCHLMQQDIVAYGFRKPYEVEIEVDVASGGAAAPVGDVVLDGDSAVSESVSGGKQGESCRQQGLGLVTEYLQQRVPEDFRESLAPLCRGVVRIADCFL